MKKENRGGAGRGQGRKHLPKGEKKDERINLHFKSSTIEKHGGRKEFIKKIHEYFD